jgi:AraC-like DNA-binding protein
MILLRRKHVLLGVDAARGCVSLHSPELRVYVARMHGGQRLDAGILNISPDQAALGSSAILIQLGGTLGIRSGGLERAVDVGAIALMQIQAWNELWDGDFRVLVFEWAKQLPIPPLDIGKLSVCDYAAFEGFATRLEAGELAGEAAAHAVYTVLARLRAAGVAVPAQPLESLYAGVPTGAQAVADALSSTLTKLHSGPQVQDVAALLGLSERQLNRRFKALGLWLPGYSRPEAWRRQLRLMRSTLAASFLTRKDTSLELVASSLGYGSARALLLALDQAGLPPPSVLRRA